MYHDYIEKHLTNLSIQSIKDLSFLYYYQNKCQEEVPLHSDKIAIVITENKDKKRMVHLSLEDFWEIYKKALTYDDPSRLFNT